MTTPTDPSFNQQFHFGVIGDIQTIWDEYTGLGVHVGVVDDGVEYSHPDLMSNYDGSMHFVHNGVTYNGFPNPGDSHGTACAGIIGALANNSLGGVGVAWNTTLTGINIFDPAILYDTPLFVASLRWGSNFDVTSNSWGYTPSFGVFQSLNNPTGEIAQANDAYGDIVQTGRGGLGTNIVQAAGNDSSNANGDGLNTSRFTITVAATDTNGNVEDYSNYGTSILISAPAFNFTTDRQGGEGYEPGDYTQGFNGTSAATPVVSGVIALMLEANPDLGWRDVQNILATSASQTGSQFGAIGSGNEVGSWMSNGATNWNGGGMSWHQSYGFGMVDAFAAVRMAEVWNRMTGVAQTTANEQIVSASYTGPPVSIPDYTPGGGPGQVAIPLQISQNINVEDIYVTVRVQHTFTADLSLTLVGPNGVWFELVQGDFIETIGGSFTWTFGVTGALGMLSAGTWTLRIEDRLEFDVGSVEAVTFDFFGSVAGTGTAYHFTQDLFDLISVDPARATITDSDGGTDWLNFAAMGKIDITVNLNGQTVAFSSTSTSLTLSGDFEAVITGDGNDTVYGNVLANTILGMRGNDNLQGGDGADRLEGGDGNDTVHGGDKADGILGGMGDDALTGDADDDTLFAQQGNDVVDGGTGHDRVFGGLGNDIIAGRQGDDSLHGEGGADVMSGGDGNDLMRGGWMSDWMYGGADNDIVMGEGGHDHLFGGRGNDIVLGGAGNDVMFGASGNDFLGGGTGDDVLHGEDGNDFLAGDTGNDRMTGGLNSDRFIFRDGFGLDTVTDFDVNDLNERIDLRGVSGITDLADLLASHLFQVGANVEIRDLAG